MSYNEGSEDYMFNMANKLIDDNRKFIKKIDEQLAFAESRLIDATNQGVREEQLKWSGYIQGLRFVISEL